MRYISLSLLLCATVACNKADFGSKGDRKHGSQAIPANGQVNPPAAPLDVSKIGGNEDLAEQGPKAGEGELYSRVVELDCDNQQGVVIDMTGPGPSGPGSSVPGTDGGGDTGDDDPEEDKGDESGFGLGKSIEVDKDGLPPKGGGKVPGKDGGKGDNPDLPTQPPVEIPEAAKVVTTVRGKFCPTSSNRLTVLFVVDFSGSMGRHVPRYGEPEIPGNDPQINGSCGRLRAAEAILAKIGAEMRPEDTVEVGMVPFAGGIVASHVMDIRGLAEFRAAVSKETFCQYVVQDPSFGFDPVNPGGIAGGIVDSSTNYNAAFTAARTALTGVYGRKVVYFVSDGEPTSGGADPVAAGIAAGADLRAQVDNLSLNALLLGAVDPVAQSVLEQVAGGPDRVRHAEGADQLADEILDFPLASIDEHSGRATLTVEPYPKAELGLRYLSKSTSDAGIWVYETQPFVLLGEPGVEVINLVEVTALGADGSTHSSIVKIRYRQ